MRATAGRRRVRRGRAFVLPIPIPSGSSAIRKLECSFVNFRVARHSGGIGGIRFGFLSRLLIYAECLLGLGFDRGETLAVAISPERMWAYNTRFCRKPDNPVFQ